MAAPWKRTRLSRRATAGHGRALLGAADPERLAPEVVRRGLNVHATERLVQRGGALIVHYRSLDQLDRVLRLLRAG